MRLLIVFLLCAASALANTCTASPFPAWGPFPASDANGVDSIGYYSARITWKSDVSPAAPTNERIVWSTAAQYGVVTTYNPGGYANVEEIGTLGITSTSHLHSWTLFNLPTGTVIHFAGQSLQGGTWCTSTDHTFTTLSNPPTQVNPVQPVTWSNPHPSLPGTHTWSYGVNCGTSGVVDADMQDCLVTKPNWGDDVEIPPGVYNFVNYVDFATPNGTTGQTAIVGTLACTISGSTCTRATGPTLVNGDAIVLSPAPNLAPSPINYGQKYFAINVSGSTFQISYDGVTAITFLDAGASTVLYEKWSDFTTQPKIYVHSTLRRTNPNLLPPASVRLGSDSLAQYLPSLVQLVRNSAGAGVFRYEPFGGNHMWFDDILLTEHDYNAVNPIDPPLFSNGDINIGGSQYDITFNQFAIAPPVEPQRTKLGLLITGQHISFLNGYIRTAAWNPALQTATYVTANNITTPNYQSNGTVITFPAFTWNWPTLAGKASCPNAGGTVTLTGGSSSGDGFVWVNPDCSVVMNLPTGYTLSTTVSGLRILNSATPAYPTLTTSVGGTPITMNTAIPWFQFAVSAGSATLDFSQYSCFGGSIQLGCETSAVAYVNALNGYVFDNLETDGPGIGGIFMADDLSDRVTPCSVANPCPPIYNAGDVVISRSTFGVNKDYLYGSPTWNGGSQGFRAQGEIKSSQRTKINGNKFLNGSGGIGDVGCALHKSFDSFMVPVVIAGVSYPNYNSSSDYTFTNNTCANLSAGGVIVTQAYQHDVNPLYVTYPTVRSLLRNNLWLNNNSYVVTPSTAPWPLHYGYGNTLGNPAGCGTGALTDLEAPGELLQIDHVTVYGQAGCYPFFFQQTFWYTQAILSNSFLWLTANPLYPNTYSGAYVNSQGLGSSCASHTAGAALGCVNTGFAGNTILAAWKDAWPASLTEYSASDIAALKAGTGDAGYAGYAIDWPAQSTYAARVASIGWQNPSAGNLRLTGGSPYKSGNLLSSPTALPTTDGLDRGADIDELERNQGVVSNVHSYGATATSVNLAFLAPDAFACGVDWGTTAFFNGTGTWTRVSGAAGSPEVRAQHVALTGLPADSLIYYRVNCQVMQPTGSVQLP